MRVLTHSAYAPVHTSVMWKHCQDSLHLLIVPSVCFFWAKSEQQQFPRNTIFAREPCSFGSNVFLCDVQKMFFRGLHRPNDHKVCGTMQLSVSSLSPTYWSMQIAPCLLLHTMLPSVHPRDFIDQDTVCRSSDLQRVRGFTLRLNNFTFLFHS